jgi:hypothetical protein
MVGVTFVESVDFTRDLHRLAGSGADSVLKAIQNDLRANPARGDVVRGLGGIRKARVADPTRQKGKRGGFRYLFLYIEVQGKIHLLYLFGKNEQDDLSAAERRLLMTLAAEAKRGR